MIISASRRTDIPAFYSQWFINRIREGFCFVPNPLNTKQVTRVPLNKEEVDAIVFWSKNPSPLIPYLPELDQKGFRYYFQFTLNDYPAALEPGVPSVENRLNTFKTLSNLLGPRRVIWRYDPVIISNYTPADYHIQRFSYIAEQLKGATFRVMISFVDYYKKTDRRLLKLESEEGYRFVKELSFENSSDIARHLAKIAKENRMEIFTCAEALDYTEAGVRPGMCIDGRLISELWFINIKDKKDPFQRDCCLCRQSKDIGINNTCLHGCTYCYATVNSEIAHRYFNEHDPGSPILHGQLSQENISVINKHSTQGKFL